MSERVIDYNSSLLTGWVGSVCSQGKSSWKINWRKKLKKKIEEKSEESKHATFYAMTRCIDKPEAQYYSHGTCEGSFLHKSRGKDPKTSTSKGWLGTPQRSPDRLFLGKVVENLLRQKHEKKRIFCSLCAKSQGLNLSKTREYKGAVTQNELFI